MIDDVVVVDPRNLPLVKIRSVTAEILIFFIGTWGGWSMQSNFHVNKFLREKWLKVFRVRPRTILNSVSGSQHKCHVTFSRPLIGEKKECYIVKEVI